MELWEGNKYGGDEEEERGREEEKGKAEEERGCRAGVDVDGSKNSAEFLQPGKEL